MRAGRGSQARGLLALARQGRIAARVLAISDSRALVRTLFLSSAARSGLLPFMRTGRTLTELVERTAATRPDRLGAWLAVGAEVGELRRRGDRFSVRGARARALAAGDELLVAHYRSVLDYQVGPYQDLAELLGGRPGEGRPDLQRHADEIARVSLAAAPFVAALVRRAVHELRPARVLDVGCGTGVYVRAVLHADPDVRVEGVDLSGDVVEAARQSLAAAGLADRARLHVGDVRRWARPGDEPFDLVMVLNSIYYFDPATRIGLFRDLGRLLAEQGQLLIASMTTPGSVAAAHLNLMLTCQAGSAALPDRVQLLADLDAAGYRIDEDTALVPTEPFVGVRARLR